MDWSGGNGRQGTGTHAAAGAEAGHGTARDLGSGTGWLMARQALEGM